MADGQDNTVDVNQREGGVNSIPLIIANRIPFGKSAVAKGIERESATETGRSGTCLF